MKLGGTINYIESANLSDTMLHESKVQSLETPVKEIVEEYENWTAPFEQDMLPEKRAIKGIEDEDQRARYMTSVISVDYQRDAENLWAKTRELWDEEPWIYEPRTLVEDDKHDDLVEVFDEHNMRFKNKDADIWFQNARTFYEDYDGTPLELFSRNDYDAPSILNEVREHGGFSYLGGDKIGPLWMRVVHEDVHKLSRIDEIDIPVDVQIRQTTKYMLGESLQDREIRRFWTQFCERHGLDPVKVDQPLWLIGTHWEEWGREYLENKLGELEQPPDDLPARSDYDGTEEWIRATATTLDVESDLLKQFYEEARNET